MKFHPDQPLFTGPAHTASPRTTLYEGPFTLKGAEETLHPVGEVFLRWLPEPSLCFTGNIPEASVSDTFGSYTYQLSISKPEVTAKAIVTRRSLNDDGLHISGVFSGPVMADAARTTTALLLHIPNWVETLEGGAEIQIDTWKVRLSACPKLHAIHNLLKDTGAFCITHVASLTRADGGEFSLDGAEEILQQLSLCLTLVRGGHVSPVLVVTLDTNRARFPQRWSFGKISRWTSAISWGPTHSWGDLLSPLKGIAERWSDESWRSAIRLCISWYATANQRASGTEASIVLCYAALERLWSHYGFTGKGASPLRAMLKSRDIPVGFPHELSALEKIGLSRGIEDGPRLLNEVRNIITHHRKEDSVRDFSGSDLYWVFTLGMWYLELVLLHEVGYSGPYSRRMVTTWQGQTVPVPWSEKSS